MKNWMLERTVVVLLLSILFLPVCASAQASTPADAIALEQQGKLAEAAQVWQAVVQKNPNDAAAFASLGVILSKEQKYQEAASEVTWSAAEFGPG
jgi:Flp pilus assembly protein TadD